MKQNFSKLFSLLIVVLLIIGLGFTTKRTQARAPWTYIVDTTEDLKDLVQNGVCSAGQVTEGPCSLRAAIDEAGRDTTFDVTIKVPPGVYTLTRTEPDSMDDRDVTYGDLDFPDIPDGESTYITIIGTGEWDDPSVIDANFIDRVMQIGKNQHIRLQNLVLKNGLTVGDGPNYDPENGGGLYIYHANVELVHVRLTNNEARSVGYGVSNGGAIYSSYSELQMSYCEVDHNRSDIRAALDSYSASAATHIDSSSFHHNIINNDYSPQIEADGGLVMTNSTMVDNEGGKHLISSISPTLIQNPL